MPSVIAISEEAFENHCQIRIVCRFEEVGSVAGDLPESRVSSADDCGAGRHGFDNRKAKPLEM